MILTLPSGLRLVAAEDGFLHSHVESGRGWEPATTRFVLETLREGDVFVDVGANAGYYAVHAASRVGPSGRVLAFEPNAALHPGFHETLRLNGVSDRVALSPVALTDVDADSVDLYVSLSGLNDGLSSLTPFEENLASGKLSYDHKVSVPARRFDTWLAETPGAPTQIDMIKIDVEGAEAHVLRGMSETLKRLRPPHLIVETWVEGEVSELLLSFGYVVVSVEVLEEGWGNVVFGLRIED